MPPTDRTKLGMKAEETAATWLKDQGYRILDRNWRRPWGELDIVAEHSDVICFVEVKASTQNVSGFEPALRADARKMHKVQRTAQTWLINHGYDHNTEWRMDVISVIIGGVEARIEHFENI